MAKKRARIEDARTRRASQHDQHGVGFVPEQAYTLGRQGGSRTEIFFDERAAADANVRPGPEVHRHDGANDSTFAWNPSDAEHYRRYAEPWDTPGVISYDGALLDGLANLSKTAHEHVGCALWCGPPTRRETVCDPATL